MQITFLGHSGFIIQTADTTLAIDPFLTENPVAVHKAKDIRADYILVTHGHGDHLGDALEIAKNSDGTIVATTEITRYASQQGLKTHGLNTGGSFDFGSFRAKLTPALHSSSLYGWPPAYMGLAGGYLISLEGKNIYHAGDTALFGDMALIGRHTIDLALLPIGDNYTMGPEDALEAINLLKPKAVIPMHYNTWELILQDAENFKIQAEKKAGTRVIILKPGESLEL